MATNTTGTVTDMTRQICHFIKTIQYEDIPPAVIERAKMMLMQTVGVSLCSAELKQMKDVIAMAKEMSAGDAEGGATLWADGSKVSWDAAAFAAGAMADCLDWEDCSITGHPSAGVIPTAVIAAEVLKKSGKEMLTAIVVGYEVCQRISISGKLNITGYNIFADLAVLCKLMDLPEDIMNQAFGIGTRCAPIRCGLHGKTMSDSLNYLYGFKNGCAISMIKTAMGGVTGMMDFFDMPKQYFLHTSEPNPEKWMTLELGKRWMMMDMLLVKHWPANMFVQTYAELAARLVTKYKFNPDDVEEVILRPSVRFRHWYSDWGFKSLTQAQFSIPYGTACAMYYPEPGAVWYKDETMVDPKIVALMNKVKADGFVKTKGIQVIKDLIEGTHPEKFMIVRMKDGTEYVESAFTHPGHPHYMLTRDQFKDRFRLETKNILTPEKTEAAIECICHLETCEDASILPIYLY